MTLARFYILENTSGWCVSLDGELTRAYDSKGDAARCAVEAAMVLTRAGYQAEIYVDGDEQSTVPFWCSGCVPAIH